MQKHNPSFILNHLGENRDNYFKAVSPPVIQSSNFVFNTIDEFRRAIGNELDHHIYTRGNNPTVAILREKMAALESAEDALIFSSGSGAISSAIISQVNAGDHIVCVQSPYSWTKRLLIEFLPRFKVSYTFVDGRDLDQIKWAIQPNTKLLYLESPNSLTFELQDLKACADLAKAHGMVTCIDNSYASPIFQRPIEYGIDLVVHSGTKYLNGHSDVVCGVVCGSKEKIHKIFEYQQMVLGNIISPHDAALIIRGLRTLDLRVKRSHDSAMKITRHLENHPKIKSVRYPGLESFPQHDLAKKQMSGFGGLFSMYLDAPNIEAVERFIGKIERFLIAVSWGGHESLILPTAAFHNIPGREDSPLPWNLARLYIGLEDPEWLLEDLEQALEVI